MRARLPIPGEFHDKMRASNAFDHRAYFGFGESRGRRSFSFYTDAAIVDVGLVDTIVTAPLEPHHVDAIVSWYSEEPSDRITLIIAETANSVSTTMSASRLNAFLRRCRARERTAQRIAGTT